jgi:hypothetical protein
MLIIFLEIILLLVFLILAIYIKNWNVRPIFIGLFAITLFVSFIIDISEYIKFRGERIEFIETYEKVKNQVIIINCYNDEKLKTAFIPDLEEKVEKINKTISTNNARCGSIWDGVFYYKDIGRLKPLQIVY